MQAHTQPTDVLGSVLSALDSAGWTISEKDGGAIATKAFPSVNVETIALSYLSKGDGINQTLSFEFYSEGANKTAADGTLIPIGASSIQVFDLAAQAVKKAERSINQSYGVRLRGH